MKSTAFILLSILLGPIGNYLPPTEKITLSVISQEESRRPGFARRERHRAIRSKSSLVPHSGLSATIPGRVYPLTPPMLVFFTNMKDNQDSLLNSPLFISNPYTPSFHTPRFVAPQTETRNKLSRTEIIFTDSTATAICLSSEEKKLYDLIMAYRKSKRLPPIPYSAKLSKVAQTHVRDLETNYNYETASTCNPHSWSTKGTWTSCCYTSDHKQASCMWAKPKEIASYIGNGYEIAYYSSAGANATEGLEGWKKSPGHNPLLINSGTWSKIKWQAIGIGIYGQYGVVWFGQEADESKMKVCK